MDFEARFNTGLGELGRDQGDVGGADLIGSGYDLMLNTTRLRFIPPREAGSCVPHARLRSVRARGLEGLCVGEIYDLRWE